MITFPNPKIDTEVLEDTTIDLENIKLYELVVFNDDINTFDHVINTLMEVCQHTPEQAEQCTLLIHYKGKASVKSGDFDELAPLRNAICQRKISAEVMLK